MAKSIFDKLNNLFEKNEEVISKTDFEESYMILRFLSMHPVSFMKANRVNLLASKIPKWAVGCYLFHSLPKARAPFFDYLKKEDKKEDKNRMELVKRVGNLFNCSDRHAEEIYTILEQRGNINELFGREDGRTNSQVRKQGSSKGIRKQTSEMQNKERGSRIRDAVSKAS